VVIATPLFTGKSELDQVVSDTFRVEIVNLASTLWWNKRGGYLYPKGWWKEALLGGFENKGWKS